MNRLYACGLSSVALLIAPGMLTPLLASAEEAQTEAFTGTAVEIDATAPPKTPPPPDKLETLQADVKKLKSVKLSGYIQFRYDQDQTSKDGVKESDGKTATNKDAFSIRRGRAKITWTGGEHAEAVLQLDASGKGVVLKDAEVTFMSNPARGLELAITAGQMKLPFGFELAQSSSAREMPERAKVVRSFFPGERDRGVKLYVRYQAVNLNLGVFNGNGIEDNGTALYYYTDSNANGVIDQDERDAGTNKGSTLDFGNLDRDAHKDLFARLGVALGPFNGGLNAYVGQWGKLDEVLLSTDEEGAPVYLGANTPTYLPKTRYGVDAQLKLTVVPSMGSTELRGEFITGSGLFEKSTEEAVDAMGYSATLIQGIHKQLALAIRYDAFTSDIAQEDSTVSSLEPALLYSPVDALRLTLAYQLNRDMLGDGGSDSKADNHLTLQLQGKF